MVRKPPLPANSTGVRLSGPSMLPSPSEYSVKTYRLDGIRYCYLAFHLTVPTHFAHATTSSRCINRSTVQYSFASSSFVAMRCTKLWQARHSHATLFSRHSSCQPRLMAFVCICFGIR